MEQATVEQAEPQGAAASGQVTSAQADGDNGAATPASFGSQFRAHVVHRAQAAASRARASSADPGASSTDEQPAPFDDDASRPGSSPEGVDARADADPSAAPEQPKLTRSQRKALKTNQPPPEGAPAAATGDTSAQDDDHDPVAARVEQIEKTVTEGFSRMEGLIRPKEETAPGEPDDDARLYGPDEEFARRVDLALKPIDQNTLSVDESEELERWVANRKVRAKAWAEFGPAHQAQFSAMFRAAAEEFGVSTEAIANPSATVRDLFAAFVDHGSSSVGTELHAAKARIAELEAANKLLADESEATQQRMPALARTTLRGGEAAVSRATQLADRSRMSGRQLMGQGISKQMTGRKGRPGAR